MRLVPEWLRIWELTLPDILAATQGSITNSTLAITNKNKLNLLSSSTLDVFNQLTDKELTQEARQLDDLLSNYLNPLHKSW
jgi:hypothetical protein